MDLHTTHLKVSRCKTISFIVERIGTFEIGKAKLPVGIEIPSGQAVPIEPAVLIRVAMVVRVGRTREGLGIDPALHLKFDLSSVKGGMGSKTYSCYSALSRNAKGDQEGRRISPHPGGVLEKRKVIRSYSRE